MNGGQCLNAWGAIQASHTVTELYYGVPAQKLLLSPPPPPPTPPLHPALHVGPSQ